MRTNTKSITSVETIESAILNHELQGYNAKKYMGDLIALHAIDGLKSYDQKNFAATLIAGGLQKTTAGTYCSVFNKFLLITKDERAFKRLRFDLESEFKATGLAAALKFLNSFLPKGLVKTRQSSATKKAAVMTTDITVPAPVQAVSTPITAVDKVQEEILDLIAQIGADKVLKYLRATAKKVVGITAVKKRPAAKVEFDIIDVNYNPTATAPLN